MPKCTVVHHRDECIGCNACVVNAPQSWVMDEESGKSMLIGATKKRDVFVAEIFACDLEANLLAAESCPVDIIKVSHG